MSREVYSLEHRQRSDNTGKKKKSRKSCNHDESKSETSSLKSTDLSRSFIHLVSCGIFMKPVSGSSYGLHIDLTIWHCRAL